MRHQPGNFPVMHMNWKRNLIIPSEPGDNQHGRSLPTSASSYFKVQQGPQCRVSHPLPRRFLQAVDGKKKKKKKPLGSPGQRGCTCLGWQGQGELEKTSAPSGGNIEYKYPEKAKPLVYPGDWKSSLININLGLKLGGGSESSIIFTLEKLLIKRLQPRAS